MPHECTNCGNTFPDGSKEMLSGCPECGGKKFKFEPSGKSKSRNTDRRAEQSGARSQSPETGDRGSVSDDTSRSDPLASRSWPGESDDSEAANARSGSGSGTTADSSTPAESQTPTDTQTPADTQTPDDSSGGIDATDDDFVASDLEPTSGRNTSPDRPGSRSGRDPHADVEMETDDEDTAQADARSEVVSGSELPDRTPTDRHETPQDEPQTESTTDSPPGDTPADSRPADPTAEDESDFEALREELNDQFESIRIVRPGQYELNLMELYDREEYIISLREDGRYVIEMPEAWDDPDE